MLRFLTLLPAACAEHNDTDPSFPEVLTSASAKDLVAVAASDTIWNSVAVSDDDRILVLFPHNEGNPGPRIGELKTGQAVAYPNRTWNAWKRPAPPPPGPLCAPTHYAPAPTACSG